MRRSTFRLFSTTSASFFPRARGPVRIPATLRATFPAVEPVQKSTKVQQDEDEVRQYPQDSIQDEDLVEPPNPITLEPGRATFTPFRPTGTSAPPPKPVPTPAELAASAALTPPPKKKERRPPQPIIPGTFTTHSLRWDQPPPTASQLSHAHRFFTHTPASFLFGVTSFRDIPVGHAPEVVILGRSNVGKSTLLNRALCTTLAHSSSRPGRTRTLNGYAVNGGRIVVLDMPGYGHGSKVQWGEEVLKYLSNRRVFRRVFLLIDASIGLNKKDITMVEYLKTLGISFQVVLNKCDKVHTREVEGKMRELRAKMETLGVTNWLGEIVGVSAEPRKKGRGKFGVEEFRWAVLKACGLEGEPVDVKVDRELREKEEEKEEGKGKKKDGKGKEKKGKDLKGKGEKEANLVEGEARRRLAKKILSRSESQAE